MADSDHYTGSSQDLWNLKIDNPARYCIRVAGLLDDAWSDRLGGLAITSSGQGSEEGITSLSGTLMDQAALFGVLNALYDLRMPLLSVECLEVDL